jgi:glucose-6-phosphate isomerase
MKSTYPNHLPVFSSLTSLGEDLMPNKYPFLAVTDDDEGLEAILAIAQELRGRFQHLVVVGTGGSSLGAKTLAYALQASEEKRQLHFLENVDAHTLAGHLASVNLSQTGYLIVSKSGTTAETLATTCSLVHAYEAQGVSRETLAGHMIVLTEPQESPLRDMARALKWSILPHDTRIGGRFSVFSNVGCLPAAFVGIDVRLLHAGARDYFHHAADHLKPALAFHQHALENHLSLTVMMPYVDRLRFFGQWFVQLWAESLGKEGKGLTPMQALGTIDQHSLLQLFRDGPRDKSFTLLEVLEEKDDFSITPPVEDHRLDYLKGKTLSQLLRAEYHATAQTLRGQGLWVRTLSLPKLDAYHMGGLLAHFMMETVAVAQLMGVNAFNQPGVEESKLLTRQYLQETP